MDIRARSILSEIRAIKGAENSVIAGGAVRDTYLGVEPKDFDIYIPHKVYEDVYKKVLVLSIPSAAKKKGQEKPHLAMREDYSRYKDKPVRVKSLTTNLDEGVIWTTSTGYTIKKGYEGCNINDVQDIEYEGIKLQLMSSPYDNDESFPEKVISKFNFGINMIYYEGSVITRDTEAFQNDVRNKTITLLNVRGIEYLPKDCEKFLYLNKKLGDGWTFKFPKLAEIMTEEPKKENTTGKYKWHDHNRGPYNPERLGLQVMGPIVAQDAHAAEGRADQIQNGPLVAHEVALADDIFGIDQEVVDRRWEFRIPG